MVKHNEVAMHQIKSCIISDSHHFLVDGRVVFG